MCSSIQDFDTIYITGEGNKIERLQYFKLFYTGCVNIIGTFVFGWIFLMYFFIKHWQPAYENNKSPTQTAVSYSFQS